MAKKKRSALKRIRQTTRRTKIKGLARAASRTAVRTARKAIDAGEDAAALVRSASSDLDRAVKRGAIHRNAANRRKSRLATQAARAKKSS